MADEENGGKRHLSCGMEAGILMQRHHLAICEDMRSFVVLGSAIRQVSWQNYANISGLIDALINVQPYEIHLYLDRKTGAVPDTPK